VEFEWARRLVEIQQGKHPFGQVSAKSPCDVASIVGWTFLTPHETYVGPIHMAGYFGMSIFRPQSFIAIGIKLIVQKTLKPALRWIGPGK